VTAVRTRYHARWVLPIASEPIEDGTVVVEGDRIAWVGPRAAAPVGGDNDDLGNAVLMPGLVNAHTHLELTVMRGFLGGLAFFDWVRTLTRARRDVLGEAVLLDSARLGVVEGLRVGITTFADTGNSSAPFDALLELGARGIAYREVFGPDPAQVADSLAGLRANVDAMRARETPLVRVGVSPHAPYSVCDALFAAAAAYAAAERLPVAVHIAEGEDESLLVERGEGPFADFLRSRGIPVAPRGRSPIALLERCGVLAVRPLLIHAVRADAADIAAMVRHRCGVAHCPASNAWLAHGVAPLVEMLQSGLDVGLGSDSMASNTRMDIVGEGRLAARQQQARSRHSVALPPLQLLELATRGGARAIGLGDVVGVLTPGYQADLAAFAVDAAVSRAQDVAAAVVNTETAVARRVVVAGKLRVRDGVVLHDDALLVARVRDGAEALARWRHRDPID
jgi:cytosine/adenosine deaminase-related metal-dependent hydrolase